MLEGLAEFRRVSHWVKKKHIGLGTIHTALLAGETLGKTMDKTDICICCSLTFNLLANPSVRTVMTSIFIAHYNHKSIGLCQMLREASR
jgi:hypothetical protein